MYLTNFGSLYIDKEDVEKCVKFLRKELCMDEGDDCHIYWIEDTLSDNVKIIFDDLSGDIDNILQKAKGLFPSLKGRLEYSGDYNGYIVINNGTVKSYDFENYGVNEALKGNSIGLELKEKLLNELENFKGNDSIELMKKMINEAKTAD